MKKSSKKFNNFGEYLYYAYANLQMLSYALSVHKPTYDKTCFMIRAKAFKAYKQGRWNIHDLMQLNIAKSRTTTSAGIAGKCFHQKSSRWIMCSQK